MISKPIAAIVHEYSSELMLDAKIFALEPVVQPVKYVGLVGPSIHPILTLHAFLYDTDWTDWDETTYEFKFEMFNGYGFNPLKDGTHHPIDAEGIKKLYNKFVDNLLSNFSERFGQSVIEKVSKKGGCQSFYFEDSGNYMEMSNEFDLDSEFKFYANFSKVVILPTGNRRVKIYDHTQAAHKSGKRITFDDLSKRIRAIFDEAYKVIVEKGFDDCLRGIRPHNL